MAFLIEANVPVCRFDPFVSLSLRGDPWFHWGGCPGSSPKSP